METTISRTGLLMRSLAVAAIVLGLTVGAAAQNTTVRGAIGTGAAGQNLAKKVTGDLVIKGENLQGAVIYIEWQDERGEWHKLKQISMGQAGQYVVGGLEKGKRYRIKGRKQGDEEHAWTEFTFDPKDGKMDVTVEIPMKERPKKDDKKK